MVLDSANKIRRITFSRSLADYLVGLLPAERLRVERMSFQIGRRLAPGETSESNLYGLLSRKTGVVLRISPIKELAYYLLDDSREAAVIWLDPA